MTKGIGTSNRPYAIGGPQLKVEVSQHDIEWGVRSDSSRCMVSKAIAREVDDATRIEVDTQTIRFTSSDKRYAYLTPLAVQRYVAAFDAGDPIEPFTFSLRNPMQIARRALTPEQLAENRLRALTGTPTSTPQRRYVKAKEQRVGPDARPAPPRVFKSHLRTYGHRLLRINQPMQATALDEKTPTEEPSVP